MIAAAEAAKAGKSPTEILRELERLKPLTQTWAMTADISHVVRGGRIPKWVKPIIELLGLTPIAKVSPQGKLTVKGGLFGKRQTVRRFAEYVARRVDRSASYRVIIGHCGDLQAGQLLQEEFTRLVPCAQSWCVETGPAVGAHAGPGALVIALQPVPSGAA